MLEWTDDLELFILKGYGKSLNYQMGVPLLKDVFQSMEQAIKAKEGNINHLIFLLRFWVYFTLGFCILQSNTSYLHGGLKCSVGYDAKEQLDW